VSEDIPSRPSYHAMARRRERCGSIGRPAAAPGSAWALREFSPEHARFDEMKYPNRFCSVTVSTISSIAQFSQFGNSITHPVFLTNLSYSPDHQTTRPPQNGWLGAWQRVCLETYDVLLRRIVVSGFGPEDNKLLNNVVSHPLLKF